MVADQSAGPYQATAKGYVARGWLGALPLPPMAKSPVPKGFTGKEHFEVDPTSADIERWMLDLDRDGRPRIYGPRQLNIGLRMPRDVLGIDVDAYGDKPGEASLAAAEQKWGPLPPTWISTSRDDGISGIRFFLVPEGLKWPNTVGPGIETVHRGHRYAVVWPSIHPKTGLIYRWRQPDGQFTAWDIPWPSKLAELPGAWIEGLTNGEADSGPTAKAQVARSVVDTWMTSGAPCDLVQAKLDQALDAISNKGSRHDSTRDLSLSIMYLGQQGHHGVGLAINLLADDFIDAVSKDRPAEAQVEWANIIQGAGQIVASNPRAPEYCTGPGCTGTILRPLEGLPPIKPPSELREAARVAEAAVLDPFWDSRPELAHIRQAARARRASPWAVLGCVLVRVSCLIGPNVVLPPLRGRDASLNLFLGIVGKSGDGKGAAEGVAKEMVRYGETLIEANVGSGEGLVHSYLRYVPAKKDEPPTIEQHTYQVLFRSSEVDTLAALKGRQGATLLPVLRDAWVGDTLGFAYATAEKRLQLNAHSYRLGLIVGVQPERSGTLLYDADGGTPQRFLWMPAVDPQAPTEKPAEPEPWVWQKPSMATLFEGASLNGRRRIPVCTMAREQIDEANLSRLRGEGDALDGHALLCRLKVAAALGILAGRLSVLDEDWVLAGIVMAQSDTTRLAQRRDLDKAVESRSLGRAEREAMVQEHIEESRESRAIARVTKGLLNKIEAASEPVALNDLRRRTKAADRPLVDEVLDNLLRTKQVICEEYEYRGAPAKRYRPGAAK